MTKPRKENRSCPAAPILVAVLVIAVPLGAYLAGYFWLGEVLVPFAGPGIERSYPYAWQKT